MGQTLLVCAAAALIPMIVGFIWYNPKVLGTVWMKASGMTDEKIKGGNMPLIFGLSYLLSIVLAFGLATSGLIIHQAGVFGVYANLGAEGQALFEAFMAEYGTMNRNFGHGVLHGIIGSLFIIMPILATNAMFERKGFKYIAVNTGYWAITLGLMGGVLAQWASYPAI